MRHVAILATHFVPSNLTSVHRFRLLSPYLRDLGWRPTIVCVDSRRYEERPDPELALTLDPELEIVRAGAMPVLPGRPFGDAGVRGFWGLFRAVAALHARDRIDFLLITIPSNYPALIGPLIERQLGIPYGIDYQDPWVRDPVPGRHGPKAWLSSSLARVLEPIAVRRASLVSGIAPGYFAGVFERNPGLSARTVAMPNGWSTRDYDCAGRSTGRLLFDPSDGDLHMVYAGALIPTAHAPLHALFSALASGRARFPRLRLHFIGTSGVRAAACAHGISGIVAEHSERIPYLDVLRNLKASSAVLILGTTDAHYSPSKIFQAILSGRPVLTFLHQGSAALDIVGRSRCGPLVRLDDGGVRDASEIPRALAEVVSLAGDRAFSADMEALEPYSALRSAEALAGALDRVTEGR